MLEECKKALNECDWEKNSLHKEIDDLKCQLNTCHEKLAASQCLVEELTKKLEKCRNELEECQCASNKCQIDLAECGCKNHEILISLKKCEEENEKLSCDSSIMIKAISEDNSEIKINAENTIKKSISINNTLNDFVGKHKVGCNGDQQCSCKD